MKYIIQLLVILFSICFSSSLYANCDLTQITDLERKKEGAVRLLARDNSLNNFILNKAKECESDGIIIKNTFVEDYDYFPFIQKMKQAPAAYTSFISENDSLGILVYEGLASALNYYLESNGIEIPEEQQIKIDGKKITAVAFSKDTKHLYYNNDILNRVGIQIPTTYKEVIAAAEKIKSEGIMEYPLGDLYNNEWELSVQFINLYLSLGGVLFKEDSAKPQFRNAEGIASLEMMKEYSKFINPKLFTGSKEDIERSWTSGNIAIGNFWGSQYNKLSLTSDTKTSTALYFKKSEAPASTIWWKGFTIARYLVEPELIASLITMLHSFNKETIDKNKDDAIWLVKGFEKEEKASGLILNQNAKTPSFPISPYISLLQRSIGNEILDFIINDTKPKKALKKMEKAYKSLAKELEYL